MARIAEDTPLIKQFFEVKAQHPEALLLYRVGDFYETYSDDAVTAARVLRIKPPALSGTEATAWASGRSGL